MTTVPAADLAVRALIGAEGLGRTGFPTVEIWKTGAGAGLPAVFAEWPAGDPGAGPLLFNGVEAAAYLWSELAVAGTRGPA